MNMLHIQNISMTHPPIVNVLSTVAVLSRSHGLADGRLYIVNVPPAPPSSVNTTFMTPVEPNPVE